MGAQEPEKLDSSPGGRHLRCSRLKLRQTLSFSIEPFPDMQDESPDIYSWALGSQSWILKPQKRGRHNQEVLSIPDSRDETDKATKYWESSSN